jgi:hypothetical protein
MELGIDGNAGAGMRLSYGHDLDVDAVKIGAGGKMRCNR